MRLAALMHLPVIQVYTHDSIGLGEDGPTHQPVEQLAHLRATPNVNVVRPADANETALAWQFALEQEDGPCALVLSRQNLPIIDPDADSRRRDRPRRLRAARGVEGRRTRADPDRHRVGGLDLPRGRRGAGGRRHRHPRGEHALLRPLPRAGRGLPGHGAPAGLPRAGLGGGGGHVRVGALGRTADGESVGMHGLRRLGARRRTCTSTSGSRPRTWPERGRGGRSSALAATARA